MSSHNDISAVETLCDGCLDKANSLFLSNNLQFDATKTINITLSGNNNITQGNNAIAFI